MKFTNFNVAIATMAIMAAASFGGVDGRTIDRGPRASGNALGDRSRCDPCDKTCTAGTIVRVSAAICTEPEPTATTSVGGAFGDPHFKTWSGHKFDFHGACDMVLLQSKQFGNGSGLDIHVRTEIRDFYSFINGVAIRIGDDIFEVFSYGAYYVNGKPGDMLMGTEEKDSFKQIATMYGNGEDGVTKQYPVEHTATMSLKRHKFVIDLGDGEIIIKVFEDFVAVFVEEKKEMDFSDSTGLMGNFETGAMISRDGATDMSSQPTEFGKEWRVNNNSSDGDNKDMILFHDQSAVPQTCTMPEIGAVALNQRKLRKDGGNNKEVHITLEEARAKCSEVYPTGMDEMRESCIYDVLATGVLELADAGVM